MTKSAGLIETKGVGLKNAFTSSTIIDPVDVLFTFVALALADKAGKATAFPMAPATQKSPLGWTFTGCEPRRG